MPLFLLALPTIRVLTRTLRHMGGVGLAVLGVLSTVLPLPGSAEAVTIFLAARQRELWWYYGLAATVGSVIGAYLPYSLGRKGGTELLARRLSSHQSRLWTKRLHAWGFGAVAVSGLLPPPLPSTPVLLAAGALHYPRGRFIGALITGRGIRYYLLAALANIYGRRAGRFMAHARFPAPLAVPLIAAVVAAGLGFAVWIWYQKQKRHRAEGLAAVASDPQNIPDVPQPAASEGEVIGSVPETLL